MKIITSCPSTSWKIDGENNGKSERCYSWESKITAYGDCSHGIKRHLFLGRKVMTNLDSILKNRDITLPTNVNLVKAMVFPVVVYGCDAAAAAKSLQSWPTLCDPIDGSPPGSPIPGILQARILEWVAIVWMWELDCKETERWRIDVFELWCLRDSWESLGLQGHPTSHS